MDVFEGKLIEKTTVVFLASSIRGFPVNFFWNQFLGWKEPWASIPVYTLIIVEMVGSSAAVSKLRQAEANGR